MTTVESRLSRLEGVYEHLATKADIAELRAEMQEMKVTLIKWVVGVQISVAGIMVAGGIAALAILV
jgi:hypothetical protein